MQDTEGVNVADIVLLAVIVCVDDAVKVADACTLEVRRNCDQA